MDFGDADAFGLLDEDDGESAGNNNDNNNNNNNNPYSAFGLSQVNDHSFAIPADVDDGMMSNVQKQDLE